MSSAQQALNYRREIDVNQKQVRDMAMGSYRDIANGKGRDNIKSLNFGSKSSSYAPCRLDCVAERKLIFHTKLKTMSTFCTRFPSTFSGAWIMIFLINSLTIAGVSFFIPTYFRIIAERLTKPLLFCS